MRVTDLIFRADHYPAAVAVLGGDIWIAGHNGIICTFDVRELSAKNTFGKLGNGPREFSALVSLTAVDDTGEMYICDVMNNRIQVLSRQGAILRIWGNEGRRPGELEMPVAVRIDADVYVLDWRNNRVQRFDAKGNFLGILWACESEDRCCSITVVDEQIFIASTRCIRVFTSDGTWLRNRPLSAQLGRFILTSHCGVLLYEARGTCATLKPDLSLHDSFDIADASFSTLPAITHEGILQVHLGPPSGTKPVLVKHPTPLGQ